METPNLQLDIMHHQLWEAMEKPACLFSLAVTAIVLQSLA